MRYRNLDLEVFPQGASGGAEQFRVRVAASPVGEQKLADAEAVGVPPDLRERLGRLEDRRLALPELIRLGEDLGFLLFPPRVRSFLERSLERLADDDGLRIRLGLEDELLADIPWEYCYIARPDVSPADNGPEGFLVLNRRISLVRHEVVGQATIPLDPLPGPYRMVVLLAGPEEPAGPALRLDVEQAWISKALDGLQSIRPEFCADATVETLEQVLARGVQFFHFAGQGQFAQQSGAGGGGRTPVSILLSGPDRTAVPFPADRLALNLADRGVRLAVLGGCQAGRAAGRNVWNGVASSLLRVGIPAVIGVQYTLREANASAFTRRLYDTLLDGQPVDTAVAEGRLAIFNRGDADERDWGSPVLYVRTEDGLLFPKAREPQPAAASQPAALSAPRPSESSLERSLFKAYDVLKSYFGLVALFGISVPQLFNMRPTDASLFAFIVLTTLTGLIIGLAAAIVVESVIKGRRGDPSGTAVAGSYRAAIVALVLAPLLYLLSVRLFQIPNTWPIQVSAGAEARSANPWIRTLPGGTLAGLDEEAGWLFNPRRPFVVGRAVHRVTVNNRSWVASPPLLASLILHQPPGWTSRPTVFLAAVASPTVYPWHPLWGLFDGRPSGPIWLLYERKCDAPQIESGWCYVDPPDDRIAWFQPSIRLGSVSARSGVDIYLELAFREETPVQSLPATLVLRQAAKGEFAVDMRQEIDLNTQAGRR